VALPPVSVPAPPRALPDLPLPPLVSDVGHRPAAAMPSPRVLACNPVGTVFGVGSELVECGRARYQRNELEAARSAFQSAARGAADRDVVREARYWLGETLLRLGRGADAERAFQEVWREEPRGEFGSFAALELGFIGLELGDPVRAFGYFDVLLRSPAPVTMISHARHGRALALYGQKRYAEARDQWTALLASNPPAALAGEVTFWLGDTLGRLGDAKSAVARLRAFSARATPPFIEPGLLSLGWWSRAAGEPGEAAAAYRRLLETSPRAPQAMWAQAGLVQALLDIDEYDAAREALKRLESADQAGTLALPAMLLARRWLAEKSRADAAHALDGELLGRKLDPDVRAWVLLMSAELARQSANPGEARDPLEVVRTAPVPPALKQHAELRLAQLDFDAREFARAQAAAQQLLSQPLEADVRGAALVLAGEAAYWAQNYAQAAAHYARFLSDFGSRPEAPAVGLALGWAEFRRGRLDAARERWAVFARDAAADPRAPGALLLAAELAARAGDAVQARLLLDRVTGQYPGTDAAEVAMLNRAVIAVNGARPAEALIELSRIEPRAATSPNLGRIRSVRGAALLAGKRDADAEAAFRSALGQGDDALCRLGLGITAMRRGQWEAAARELSEARDAGAGSVGAAIEYGLAAAAFNQGKTDEFKKIAAPLLAGPNDPAITPRLLRGMEALAVEDKRWSEARALAMRLVDQFPRHEATPEAVAEVGAGAGDAGEWRLAREMYQILGARYPSSAGRQAGRVIYAEALLRTSSAADARRELEAFVASAPAGDPRRARALSLLAESQEATGDRAAAAQSYARFATENPTGKDSPSALLAAGRLLQADGRWDQARPLLERAMRDGDAAVTAEAAYRTGEGLRAADRQDEAVEAYMTAAYVAPDSAWARRALLGAGRSFAALKQNDAAAIVYRKLLASAALEPDLATAARSGLKALGAN
jgi:TolA-binding protein